MSELLWADRKITTWVWVGEGKESKNFSKRCLSLEWEDKSPAGNPI